MCGICGVVNFGGLAEHSDDQVRTMTETLRHRGPDGDGYYFEHDVALGHRRLSVIDLATGDQPITNENGSIVITLNGEIYNFVELREELLERGHHFSTRSDTEVVVHLYEELGTKCVQRLRGMFAFALWDGPLQRLFLARDRLGKKPLYYTRYKGAFLFASELKALLKYEQFPRSIDLAALDNYLTYLYVPPPHTIFEGIFKLPPAHWLIYDWNGVVVERYWDISFTPKVNLAEQEIFEALLEKLEEATRIRLVSDVPLGAFLSGGIDSSVVVALMSKQQAGPVKTFSVGFTHEQYNELFHAKVIADLYGTDHHEIMLTANAAEVLPELAWAFDEPYADPSAIPTYYVSEAARQNVTVALNGDGGDELFAGYGKYLGSSLRTFLRLVPHLLRKSIVHRALQRIPEGMNQKSGLNRLRRLNDLSLVESAEANVLASVYNGMYRWRESLYSPDLKEILSGDPLDRLRGIYNEEQGVEELDRFLRSDLLSYLPDDLLVKVDRMAMAHGLEARSPYLDHELVEFVATLPTDMKLRGVTGKYALRKVGEHLGLPGRSLSRPKQGFEVPIADWMRADLREMRNDLLHSSKMVQLGYFNEACLEKLVAEHDRGTINHAERLYALLMLELWYRSFMS